MFLMLPKLRCRVLEKHYDAAVGYIPQLHPAEFRLYISLVIPDVRGKGCFPYTGLNLLPQLEIRDYGGVELCIVATV